MSCPRMGCAEESCGFVDPACDHLHNSDSMESKLAVGNGSAEQDTIKYDLAAASFPVALLYRCDISFLLKITSVLYIFTFFLRLSEAYWISFISLSS